MKTLKELIKLIMKMLKEDPDKLAEIRGILGEMKWVLAVAFGGAALILSMALAVV